MIFLLLALAAGPPTIRPPVLADSPILDRLRLFTPEGIARAEHQLAVLRELHGYEMRIETLDRQPAPEGLSGFWYWHLRQAQLRMWVHDRARDSGMEKGLYVVITQRPLDVRVEAWPADTSDKFLVSRRDTIRRGMLEPLKLNYPERALAQGIERFSHLLEQTQEKPSPFNLVPYLILIAVLSGLWIGLCLLSRRLVGTQPLYPPAVQGGILGTPAASWIYDRLFQDDQEKSRA
jgi:hypothetical protein